MDARILLKYSTSKCNKELLNFLHQNIEFIKKKFSLKVLLVYDDQAHVLGNSIKTLPILIIPGESIVGNTSIKNYLLPPSNQSKKTVKPPDDCDLENFWNDEMHSGTSDNVDEAEDIMDSVKRRVLDQSKQHREDGKNRGKKKDPVVSSVRQNNIKIGSGEKISDMVGDDALMQNFWENQEHSPGCE
jgi:hypothetical protein